ncbi:SpaA isopeptide-forming pilin-related protein [Lactobacillus gasseri]|uniref:SpaA isopeptide-forming pilin-related protein n=2 Tax=Lactobacillus TaxID=1578 RepID=UPI001191176A|nr:SpaA isopeptide-forming pilin-related protein [Lactobacillus gasseri]TVU93231.1 hypothetical protein FOF75_03730 [Lactobacillus gasseri]TVV16297.1 hypothetical protein FOF66_02915 [Lactobacillus gasseri]
MHINKLASKTVLALFLATTGVAIMHPTGVVKAYDSPDKPQYVTVTARYFSCANGKREDPFGPHSVNIMKRPDGNVFFCLNWEKESPSNESVYSKGRVSPQVEWLVNDFYSPDHGGERYRSLGWYGGDYWLYQSVIHWVASPNDYTYKLWDSSRQRYVYDHNITWYMNHDTSGFDPTVLQKLKDLYNKAMSVKSYSESEHVNNASSLYFASPNSKTDKLTQLMINPTGARPNGDDGINYEGTLNLQSQNVHDTKVWSEGAPEGATITGANLNNVLNDTNLTVKIPYNIQKQSQKSFKVKAEATWDKSVNVGWAYRPNSNTQNVTRIATVSYPVKVDTETTVNWKTRRYLDFVISKKDMMNKPVAGAKFVLVRKDKDLNNTNVQIPIAEAKKEAYRQVNGELVRGHEDQSPYIATSDKDGNLSFNKVLVEDTGFYDYYAVEVGAPNGYSLSPTAIRMSSIGIPSPNTIKGEMKDSTNPIPTTGSKRLLAIGAFTTVMVIGAGGLMYYHKKKSDKKVGK